MMLDSLDHSVTNLLKTPLIRYYLDMVSIIFGLNALNGKDCYRRSFCSRALGFINSAALSQPELRHLCGNGIGVKVTAAQYASDVIV
ncbi:hypothetical protein MKW92_003440 [Papaver armeniacum]|nr:hypothetical protein MKW92_003440 [Papaver armeniacum]